MVVFFKKSLISGTFLSTILVAARVGEEELSGVAVSTLESLWASSPAGLSEKRERCCKQ
jgi:hypothetical protein